MVEIISTTPCQLGEGPLWHPTRNQFFWFDILGKRLMTIQDGVERDWAFDEYVSAAGWVEEDTLIIASATALWKFEIKTGDQTHLVSLESDNPLTRSNDGRADPWGGFWIGTMGINIEPGAGAIYRYYRGELRKLYRKVTIPNAICFALDRSVAYYTDTDTGKMMRQPLEPQEGWPVGKPEVFLDLSGEDFGIDGSVVDAAGNIWNAQWGAGRVVCYSPEGAVLTTIEVPTLQATCPAFGGADLNQLYVTTAADGGQPAPAGQTFRIDTDVTGQPEPQVFL